MPGFRNASSSLSAVAIDFPLARRRFAEANDTDFALPARVDERVDRAFDLAERVVSVFAMLITLRVQGFDCSVEWEQLCKRERIALISWMSGRPPCVPLKRRGRLRHN